MRTVSCRLARFILVLLVLVASALPAQAGITHPAGSLVYWNPVGTSTDGDDPNNWSTTAPGTGSASFLPTLSFYILSFHGTGPTRNADCVFDGGTVCAGLQSNGGYGGVITIASDTFLTVQGVLDLTVAQRLVIGLGGGVVLTDDQRAGSSATNALSVPVQLQAAAGSRATVCLIANGSLFDLTIAGVISGPANVGLYFTANGLRSQSDQLGGTTILTGASTLAGAVLVGEGWVTVDGSLPASGNVGLSGFGILEVNGAVGDVEIGAEQMSQSQTAYRGVILGAGQMGDVKWNIPPAGIPGSSAPPPGGSGVLSVMDFDRVNGVTSPSHLRASSVLLATSAGELAELNLRVAAMTGPGVGYSRLAINGSAQGWLLGISPSAQLAVDISDLIAASPSTPFGRIPGVVTHPAGQRLGYFSPTGITVFMGGRLQNQSLRALEKPSVGKGSQKAAVIPGSVVVVPDYRSTGIDLVLADPATLPAANFTANAASVFSGQNQATLGVVTLSSAPTTTVVLLYTDDIGGQVATATAADLPDFNAGNTHMLVFQPGETAKPIITSINEDPSATFNKTFSLTLASPPESGAVMGSLTTTTVTIVRGTNPLTMTVNTQPISAPTTLAAPVPVGQPLTVVLKGGQPPFTGVGSGLQFLAGPMEVEGGLPKQTFSVIAGATSLDPSAFSFADSRATPRTTPMVQFNILPAEVAPVAPPALPVSQAPTTIYAPLCPATPQGLANLLSVVGGASSADVAAYAWDSSAQAYAKLPAQPSGGLTPTHAVFVASRIGLAFDFSGVASPMYSEILLRPGWNFIGVPPIDDGGSGAALTLHELNKLILFPTGSGVSSIDGAERAALIGTAAYFWDGAAYAQVTTLETSKGYWLRNNSAVNLVLVRAPAPATGVARGTDAGAQAGLVRYLDAVTGAVTSRAIARSSSSGNPPPPPGSSSSSAATGNACGSGSGIAAFALLLLAAACHLLLVRRR